ncbi:MAG: response regulator [Balneolales bacterium]
MTTSTLSLAAAQKQTLRSAFGFIPRGLQLVQRAPKGLKPLATGMQSVKDKHHKGQINNGSLRSEPIAPYRVLQVEDNSENRFIVHRYLQKDYFYDAVDQGEHALDIVSSKAVDVIIMDINLGSGIDGIETACRIRENENNKHIAIVAVTANVSPDIKQKCFDAGMDAFLPKPFRKEQLTEAMNKAIKGRKNKNN